LTHALANGNEKAERVKILERRLPPFMCTFPNEIVTCQLPTGRKRRLFIKYAGGQSHDSFGHRGNVCYEAQVYQRFLQFLPNFRPRCLGTHTPAEGVDSWLILEYIDNSVRLSDLTRNRALRQPRAMATAAQWLGEFHLGQENRVFEPALSFLKRYDAAYYRGWARRTYDFAEPLRSRFPWLGRLKASGDRWFAPLMQCPRTVIHGEFYAKNLLLRRTQLFMLDWESTAIAAGEIDLAALTEGIHWPAKLVALCERMYVCSRWPKGAPSDFGTTLDAARVYLHFRWLGERPEWATRPKSLWRYEHLKAAAERLGLI
jgi:aminoglycoside phosphotransferase (APT) family kinase protein